MLLLIGLIIIGIILLVLEILVLPGFIAGVAGGVLIFVSVLWMYQDHGTTAGHITAASSLIITISVIFYSLKTKAWNRYGLKDQIDSKVNDVGILGIVEGDEGKALSALRPSGTVIVNNKKIEVQTNGEFLDAGTKVVVTKVLPNKLMVKIKVTELT